MALGQEDGRVYNINADAAAAQISVKLQAEKFILITDVPGVLRNPGDENSLMTELNVNEIDTLIRQKVISGGMIPKVNCCIEAVKGGVKRTHIIDGRVNHSLLLEIFSNEGIGTMIL